MKLRRSCPSAVPWRLAESSCMSPLPVRQRQPTMCIPIWRRIINVNDILVALAPNALMSHRVAPNRQRTGRRARCARTVRAHGSRNNDEKTDRERKLSASP